MMANYILTNKAVEDLGEIWDYTFSTWSEKQAVKYYQQLFDCFEYLTKNPESGKEYTFIYPDLKGKQLSKHVMFYRRLSISQIEITRILHQQMDFESHFL